MSYETARQPELGFATFIRGLSKRQLQDLMMRNSCPVRLEHLRAELKLHDPRHFYGRGERDHG